MKNLIYYITSMSIFIALGCGTDLTGEDKEELERLRAEQEVADKAEEEKQTEAEAVEKSDNEEFLSQEPVYLRGYLSSSFTISVDDQSFEDSEDFYSAQIEKMEAEKIAQGFEGYDLELKGRLGLADLKYGMSVYIESAGEEGYGAETVVVADGTFEVRFPPQASGDTFQIRANKRIGVVLSNDEGDVVHWCYNFYGRKVAEVTHDSKPVILREFFTKLTKYDCQVAKKKDGTLGIPQHVSEVVPDDKASTEAQNDQWDREWEESIESATDDDNPTQEQIDKWDQEWNDLIEEQNKA